MKKHQTMKKVALALLSANVVASTVVTAMPTLSMADEVTSANNETFGSKNNLKAATPFVPFTSIAVASGATTIDENNRILLTNNTFLTTGGMMTKEKINLRKSDFHFNTTLDFGNGSADGISFVMQNNGNPSVFGGKGDSMGLAGLKNALGIAMRAQTYYTPSRQNVSFYANNEFIDKKDTPVPLTGTVRDLSVFWDASERTLTYSITGVVEGSYQVANLTDTFGGEEAYIGLVGVAGQGTSTHTATNTELSIDTDEDPVIEAADKTLFTGQPFSPLADVRATDEEDGDVTNTIKVTANDVDTSKAGVYHVTYSVTDSAKKTITKTITVRVNDLAAPTISPITDKTTTITVTGLPLTETSLVLPDDTRIIKRTDADGKATFSVSNLVADQEVKAFQTEYGAPSLIAKETVVAATPNTPSIAPFTTTDTQLVVTGEAGASISVKLPNGSELTEKAGVDGKATFNIGAQEFGATIEAKQTATNGKTSVTSSTTVTQGAVATPTINALTTDDTTVTGTGIAGASVKVKANNIEYTDTVKVDGTYSITIPKQTANTVVTATQTLNNMTSNAVSATVKSKVATTLTAGDFTVGADNYIKGTYTGDIAKLAIEVNGTIQQTINATGSPYQYYAKGQVNATTDQVYVIGYDATGKQLQKTKVNIKQQATGTVTPNMYYIGKDNYVTGKLSGDVAKFSLTVNGVEYSKINVTTAPDFKYYANSLIKNVTDTAKVNAYDASGRLLDSKPLSVTTYQGEEGEITSISPFKLGKDSYVTGAYTGDVRKVELQVNGVALQRINVSDGIIKYYAKANIAKATDEVKLVGFNAAGVAVSTKPITITSTDGSVAASPFALGKDGYVTGAYTGDVAKISLTVNGVKQSTINVPAGSEFKYYAKTLIKSASDIVVLTAYDTTGGVLSTINITIDNSATMTSGTVTPNTFKIGTNSYVDGTYTGDVAKVELEVNGVKYGQIPATGNTIHYYAASLITQASDVVKVNVYDTAGKQLDSKLVSITAPTGTVTASDTKVDDIYLSGIATGDVTKVTLSINGTIQSSIAFVQADKSYRYYIKNLNLKPTDDVKIIGMDARGNTLSVSEVTINN
ncbi:DUF5011 domain-containing protein [Listeria booriae]|uniref:immunoglobulin-like domain-containing protein n=1 Tax=Listeria booriae TaxID=1552123 RepID=UPI0016289364|nr:immunoglobulin-like domain-containing protein [Listeria booriae]MBC2317866.1 DUF5011 domain-containing protein [Listeria booriae]